MTKIQELSNRILVLLPGGDCGGYGGCGLSSCQACADAIIESHRPDLCPACNSETVAAIAELIGAEPVEVADLVAYIKCAGHSAGKERFKDFESCQAAKESGFIDGECQYGCIGLGCCVERCKFDAMSVSDGIVTIDPDKCNGCMACVTGCVQNLIQMVPRDATNFIPCSSKDNEQDTLSICGFGCIGCGDCQMACPENAIEMIIGDKITGRYAAINYDKCVGCVTCTVRCRKKIIVDTLHDLGEVKEEIAMVQCIGAFAGNAKLKEAGYTSCKDADKLDLDAMGICEYSCLGLGDCVKVCRYGALSNDYGIASVDNDKCVGCGDCMRECPREKILISPYKGVKQVACTSVASPEKRMAVCTTGCIGCGDCVDNCPNGAIKLVNNSPIIDPDKCENCGICTYVCSRVPLQERVVPEYNYIQHDALMLDERK